MHNQIVLRGSTGQVKNPFLGTLWMKIRFSMARKMLTPDKSIEFYGLKSGAHLKTPILGISFLKEHDCTLNFKNDTFRIKNKTE